MGTTLEFTIKASNRQPGSVIEILVLAEGPGGLPPPESRLEVAVPLERVARMLLRVCKCIQLATCEIDFRRPLRWRLGGIAVPWNIPCASFNGDRSA